MYQPKHFTETEREEIIAFMQDHPFITMIVNDGSISHATQIPVLIEQEANETIAKGHIFKHTDHYQALINNNEVLLLFTGPHCYVSASWYTKRGQASTWNYMTVQARGKAEMTNDAGTLAIITELTNKYEQEQAPPELVANMDESYIKNNIQAIAGFTIQLTDIKATFKLNQNKDDESYKNVVSQLSNKNHNSKLIAQEMKKRKPELF